MAKIKLYTFGQPALVPFVLLHASAWLVMLVGDKSWVGSWKLALDVSVSTLTVSGLILAGLSSHFYAIRAETSLPQLVALSGRALLEHGVPGLQLYLIAALSYLMLVGELSAYAVMVGLPIAGRQYAITLLVLLMVLVYLLIGGIIGSRVPVRFAAILGTTIAFLMFLLALVGFGPEVLVPGAVGSMTGLQYRFEALWLLSAEATLLIIGLLLLAASFATGSNLLRIGPRAGAIAGAIFLCASVAVDQVAPLDAEARLEPAPMSYRCEGSDPWFVWLQRHRDQLEMRPRR